MHFGLLGCKLKAILKLLIAIVVFIIFSSIVLASRTYVIYEDSKSNTYVVPQKLSGKNEVYVLRQKANRLNPIYYEVYERNEEKERLFKKKFRRYKSWFGKRFYYGYDDSEELKLLFWMDDRLRFGYDEEIFGSKNLYLNWEDAEEIEELEDFYPMKGYKYFKDKTFVERIEKYSVK